MSNAEHDRRHEAVQQVHAAATTMGRARARGERYAVAPLPLGPLAEDWITRNPTAFGQLVDAEARRARQEGGP